ncbi:Chromosome-anchoring protein like [Actinidia chinensis var. chinensis]|uniref:Chromosome-anchoring protein like n=1 Tax=Actinidia chinensis var. chinensis TaxID=1590841 RepID=A0A2R6QHJ8_ACTCC|nr:Chromosome-anchoring protein like [Actinidia chinensis var. chinensis]
MPLCSCLLSRPSASSPLENRAHPVANTSQAPNLEGIHREMHGITEKIRIMNKINARLEKHLATNNQPPPAAPISEDANQSRRSHRSGDQNS